MDKKTEALKLALEALEYILPDTPDQRIKKDAAITAIREALAEQPAPATELREQQEPVAYAVYHRMGGSKTLHWPEQHSEDGDHNEYRLVPLYEHPPAQQQEWVADVGLLEYKGNSVAYIHQKMKAYRNGIDAAWDAMRAKGVHPDGKTSLADMIAKHISQPASKPWVGLSTSDLDEIDAPIRERGSATIAEIYRAIEAKLREKNS